MSNQVEPAEAADAKNNNRQTPYNGNNCCNKILGRDDPRRWARYPKISGTGRYIYVVYSTPRVVKRNWDSGIWVHQMHLDGVRLNMQGIQPPALLFEFIHVWTFTFLENSAAVSGRVAV